MEPSIRLRVDEKGSLIGFLDESHYLLFLGRIEDEYIAVLLPKEAWGKEGEVENAIIAQGSEFLDATFLENFCLSSIEGVWQARSKDLYLVKNSEGCFFGKSFERVEKLFAPS